MSLVTPSQQEYHERWKAARARLRHAPIVKAFEPEEIPIVNIVEEIERSLIIRAPSGDPRIALIQRAVCLHFGVTRNDMLSQRRSRIVARPRQVAMFLARHMTRHTLPEIGRRFGGRDHTTVIHAVNKVSALIAADEVFARDIELVRAGIWDVIEGCGRE